ncbi:hypothetical protein [uncultured Sphingomonas sp.]|uniref:hypothetical protein n=1 Tax=uncultured Sphingomonas sp. TaxID=158754 RepID=UPI00263629AE|nr:hypothetical protein [uncultured Sphingomonas sp.]
MERIELIANESSDKTMVILQSLLCLLREKNLLTRADIEDLCDKVQTRASAHAQDPLPCCVEGAAAAASEMERLGKYIGNRYGGKHRRI